MKGEKGGARLLALALVLVLALSGCVGPQQAPAGGGGSRALGDSTFTNLVTTGNVTVGGSLTATGGASSTTTVGAFVLSPAVAVPVTDGGTLTLAWAYQQISATGTVGLGLVAASCKPAGKVSVIENVSNQTVTITDTTNILLAGNAALGQYDTLTLIGDGTNCVQIAKSDN